MGKKGILITLEGNEGCGKSTQIRLLYKVLREDGRKVFLTREPGGTRVSDAIRSVLLDARNKGMSGVCETLLYMASRAELVSKVIKPKLKKGFIVLCDRWLDATVAYQGYGEGADKRWIRSLGETVTQGTKPVLTVFLDLPLELGLRRARRFKKADRMERKNIAFHKRVRQGYLQIAKKERSRFKRLRIQAGDSIFSVHQKVKELVGRVV